MADKDLDVYEVVHKTKGTRWFMSEEGIRASDGEWTQGKIVSEARGNLLLTVGGQRAFELLIAQPPVKDIDELKSRIGIAPDVEFIRAADVDDDFVFFLNRQGVVALLFFIAIICVYLELHLMTGILGLISALCLILFFWSKWLGGTADSLEILLFMFGVVCVAMEIFVLPGAGVFGVTGVLSIAASLVMASQTFNILDEGQNLEEATRTLGTLGIALLAVGSRGHDDQPLSAADPFPEAHDSHAAGGNGARRPESSAAAAGCGRDRSTRGKNRRGANIVAAFREGGD